MAEDLASALRFAETAGGASLAAKERQAEAEGAAAAARASCAEETEKCTRLRGELEQMKALFKQMDRTRAASDEQLAESMARIRALSEELSRVNRAKAEGSGAMASLHAENERLRAALAASQSEEDGLCSKLDDSSRRLAEQAAAVAALQRSLAAARVDNDATSSEAHRLTNALASRDRENAVLRGAVEEAEAEKRNALGERDLARAEAAKSHQDTGALSSELQRISFTLFSLQQQLADAKSGHNATKVSLSQAEAAFATSHADRERLIVEYRDLEQRWLALDGELRVSTDLRTRCEAQLAVLASEKNATIAQLKREEEVRSSAETMASHFAEENGVLEMELAMLSKEKNESERNVVAAKSETVVLQKTQNGWAARLGELERERDRARDETHHANARLASARAAEHAHKEAVAFKDGEIRKRDLLLSEERQAMHRLEVDNTALRSELGELRKVAQGAAELSSAGARMVSSH